MAVRTAAEKGSERHMSPAAQILRFLIRCYQLVLSPLMGPSCRYDPSCSAYALEAVLTHGAVRGSYLAVRRILRCHPWGGWGYDPVPAPREGCRGHHVNSRSQAAERT